MNTSNVVAIIPARAGSKRIKNKNFKDFLGTPIIEYPISLLNSNENISSIVVSTDSNLVNQFENKYKKLEIYRRNPINSDDYASTVDAVKEVLNAFKFEANTKILCVYPCTPFLTNKEINEMIISSNRIEDGFTIVAHASDKRFLRGFVKSNNSEYKLIQPKYLDHRTQDLPDFYIDAGQAYIARVDCWLKSESILKEVKDVIKMNIDFSPDIDNIEDWHEMETKAINYGKARSDV